MLWVGPARKPGATLDCALDSVKSRIIPCKACSYVAHNKSKLWKYSLDVFGHQQKPVNCEENRAQTAQMIPVLRSKSRVRPRSSSSSVVLKWSWLFILSRRRGDLSPVGYSATSVMITIRRITGTSKPKSPHELTDHHLYAVSSFLPLPSLLFRYSIYLCDTRLQEASFLLILPLKFPISPVCSTDANILVEMLPYPSCGYHNLI